MMQIFHLCFIKNIVGHVFMGGGSKCIFQNHAVMPFLDTGEITKKIGK